MKISGLTKVTLVDYPGLLASIVFVQGCNFHCPFCQNSIFIKNKEGDINEEEVLNYLSKRKNILDGVVISGGEPTNDPDLKKFIQKVKNLGYKVKLDTNGYRPDVIKNLLDNKLIDYIAMDIKNILDDYEAITGLKQIDIQKILTSINIIQNSNIEHEFRTTIIKEYHNISKLKEIVKLTNGSNFYIQNFECSLNVPNKKLHGFEEDELKELNNIFKENSNVVIRGL